MLYHHAFRCGDEVSSTFPCRHTPGKLKKYHLDLTISSLNWRIVFFETCLFEEKSRWQYAYPCKKSIHLRVLTEFLNLQKEMEKTLVTKYFWARSLRVQDFDIFTTKIREQKRSSHWTSGERYTIWKAFKSIGTKLPTFSDTIMDNPWCSQCSVGTRAGLHGHTWQISTSDISVGCNEKEWGFWKER